MTHRLSRLASVEYNTESTFAADTSTYATRLLPLGQLDLSGLRLNREMVPILQQRPHDGIAGVRTFYSGSFSLEFLLTGHGSTAAGAITATDLGTLLGYVVGNLRTSDDGGTVDAGSTSTVIQGASITTLAAGTMCRIGSVGDGRGNGQFYPVSVAASSSDFTIGFAVDSTPNQGDVVYASQVVYPSETPSTFSTVQSLRFRFATPNEQYECHGCWPTGIEFLNLDTLPRVRLSFDCAWWESISNVTFPTSSSTNAKTGAPVAGGSLVLNTVGTSTRTKYNYQDLNIRIVNDVIPIRGPGSAIANTNVIDVRRSKCCAYVSCTFPAEGTGDQTHFLAYLADSLFHMCITLSAVDGQAVGFYFPNLRSTDQTPIQRDYGALNRVPVEFEALTGQTTTNDLTMSNWRLAMG